MIQGNSLAGFSVMALTKYSSFSIISVVVGEASGVILDYEFKIFRQINSPILQLVFAFNEVLNDWAKSHFCN